MAQRRKWKLFCLFVPLFASMPMWGQQAAAIPATHGRTLTGTNITLPDALKAKITIIVLGFSRASQEQVGNWGRLIEADYGKSLEIDYFEMAMLGAAPKMLRGMIIKRLGSSVPFDQRPHYLTILEGDQAWRAVAHYDKGDDGYVLLVDNKGTVLWQTQGEPTNSTYGTFKTALAKLLKAQSAQVPLGPHSTASH